MTKTANRYILYGSTGKGKFIGISVKCYNGKYYIIPYVLRYKFEEDKKFVDESDNGETMNDRCAWFEEEYGEYRVYFSFYDNKK